MNSPTRPGWARTLGVLPDYIGGYLEWDEQRKKYRGKIKSFCLTEKTLFIELAWTIEQHYSGDLGMWIWRPQTIDHLETLSLKWEVSIVNKASDASFTRGRVIAFKMTLLKTRAVFKMTRRESHATRTTNELVQSLKLKP